MTKPQTPIAARTLAVGLSSMLAALSLTAMPVLANGAPAPAPAPAPAVAVVPDAPAAAPADGRMLAQACAGCHGQDGAGMGAIASIRGLDQAEFIRIWEEFRTDARRATIMNRIARGYTDAEVAALAAYFEALQ